MYCPISITQKQFVNINEQNYISDYIEMYLRFPKGSLVDPILFCAFFRGVFFIEFVLICYFSNDDTLNVLSKNILKTYLGFVPESSCCIA